MRRGLKAARYLLVWPALAAYRRLARRSLRWRLAGYNLATLMAGLAATLTLVGLLTAWGFAQRDVAAEEPAEDARAVAEFLGPLDAWIETSESLARLVTGLASGEVPLYRAPGQSQFDLRPRQYLQGVRAIAVFTSDGSLMVATDDWVEGDGATSEVLSRAMSGSLDLRQNSRLLDGPRSEGVGAFPVLDGERVAAVVVVEKATIQAPRGRAVLAAEIKPVASTVLVGSVIAIVPGLGLAALLAFLAARTVAEPVRELSLAAGALAAGDLGRRVTVRGEDEVASLATSFNAMGTRIQETLGALTEERERAVGLLNTNRQLVANVSHELRTPVAIVRGQLEVLEVEAPGNERLQMALRETGRLEEMIGDLFQLASADANALDVRVSAEDVGAAVAEALQMLREPAWREARVSLIFEPPGAPIFAMTDRERLVRVLQNLLRNAIRHTPEGGLVQARVETVDGGVSVAVSDTGPGIAVEDLPHIFDRFYRGDASRSRTTGGAGLGLAIAKEFIEVMGGTIEATSVPGEGATFTIRLPAA